MPAPIPVTITPAYQPIQPLDRPDFYTGAWSRQCCRECYAGLPNMDLRLSGRDCGIKGSIPAQFLNANLRWRRA